MYRGLGENFNHIETKIVSVLDLVKLDFKPQQERSIFLNALTRLVGKIPVGESYLVVSKGNPNDSYFVDVKTCYTKAEAKELGLVGKTHDLFEKYEAELMSDDFI